MSEFDKDSDFSIDSILKAAQKNSKGSGKPDKPIIPAAGSAPKIGHSHTAPHALTPEEVINNLGHKGNLAPPPEIAKKKEEVEFIVFETNINPDEIKPASAKAKTEVASVTAAAPSPTSNSAAKDTGASVPTDIPSKAQTTSPTAASTAKTTAAPKAADISPKAPAAAPAAPSKPALTFEGESLYERMKKIQEQKAAEFGTTKPSADKPAPAVNIPVKKDILAADISSKAQTANPTSATAAKTTAAPAVPKAADISPKAQTANPTAATAAKTTAAPIKRSTELSVEEVIKRAEQHAEGVALSRRRPGVNSIPVTSAAYYKRSNDETPKPPAKPAQPKFEEHFAPIKRPVDNPPPKKADNIVTVKNLDVSSNERKGHSLKNSASEVESFSGGVYSRQTLKVTPLKRSRVFITPTSPEIVTPATKVVAKEVSVDVNIIDKSLEEKKQDDRIKAHNPYASQYSLADAEIAEKKSPAVKEIPVDDIDIITNTEAIAAIAEREQLEKTIQFSAVENNDDFNIDNIIPPEKQAWERDFENDRKTTAKKFKLFGNDEPEVAPEDLPLDEEPDSIGENVLSDYETIEDADSIKADLDSRVGRIIGKLVPTFLITLIMFILASPFADAFRGANATAFCAANLALLAVCAAINFKTMKGIVSLVTLHPDSDSPAALAVTAALIQGIVSAVIGSETSVFMGALGCLALTFNLIGKLLTVRTIRNNFAKIATEEPKKSIFLLDDPEITAPIAGGSVLGEALICTGRKIRNAKDFLKNSYKRDPYEKTLPRILIFGMVAALAAGIAAAIFVNIEAGLILFAAILCLCCPPSTSLLSSLPLSVAAKRLAPLRAEIAGFSDAENFSYANAMTIDADELFPKGKVVLFNMHILSAHPVDQSILEAAAIARAVKSPLAQIFDGMISDDMELPVVDTITYENKMGVSGWLGEKRIFIGNRTLMETHGIPLPSLDVDKRILKSGYFPVYLASTEGPGALFIVGYEADEEISYQLRRLTATGVTLLVNACDQNINEDMICDYFEIHPDSVKVMSPQVSKIYLDNTAPSDDGNSAGIVASDAAGTAALLTACIRVKEDYTACLAVQIVGICLGIALACFLMFTGGLGFITTLSLGIFQLVFAGITSLIPLIRRP